MHTDIPTEKEAAQCRETIPLPHPLEERRSTHTASQQTHTVHQVQRAHTVSLLYSLSLSPAHASPRAGLGSYFAVTRLTTLENAR